MVQSSRCNLHHPIGAFALEPDPGGVQLVSVQLRRLCQTRGTSPGIVLLALTWQTTLSASISATKSLSQQLAVPGDRLYTGSTPHRASQISGLLRGAARSPGARSQPVLTEHLVHLARSHPEPRSWIDAALVYEGRPAASTLASPRIWSRNSQLADTSRQTSRRDDIADRTVGVDNHGDE